MANILRHWRDGEDDKLAQLVFCDISTPTAGKGSFNIYNDIKKKLIAAGMSLEQIAFIHDADTDEQKKALCAGDPRIKERMELDVEVSRLCVMKADCQSKKFRLEDNVVKHFTA